jgi:hypothetical protein
VDGVAAADPEVQPARMQTDNPRTMDAPTDPRIPAAPRAGFDPEPITDLGPDRAVTGTRAGWDIGRV